MNALKRIAGALLLLGAIALILLRPLPWEFDEALRHHAFMVRAFYILILAGVLCLFRILRGPTAADRIVAIDIFGILIVGFCALGSVATGRSWYLDIGIAWALQSFIGTLAFSKYLEGRAFDE